MLVLKLIHVSQRGPCHSRSHYSDVIMGTMASQITSLTIVYSTVYSGGDQRKYQSSVSLAFVRGIHRWPVNSPHKWSVTRKRFPFDDVIMIQLLCNISRRCKSLRWSSAAAMLSTPPVWILEWDSNSRGNPPITNRFPSQRASNAKPWWCFPYCQPQQAVAQTTGYRWF